MATLFWILGAVAGAIAAARYVEEDRLFWILTTSFFGTLLGGFIVKSMIQEDKEKIVVVEKAPTQVLDSMPGTAVFRLADMSIAATKGEKSPKPVSKDSLINDDDSLLSEVHATTRGQPLDMYYDDS